MSESVRLPEDPYPGGQTEAELEERLRELFERLREVAEELNRRQEGS